MTAERANYETQSEWDMYDVLILLVRLQLLLGETVRQTAFLVPQDWRRTTDSSEFDLGILPTLRNWQWHQRQASLQYKFYRRMCVADTTKMFFSHSLRKRSRGLHGSHDLCRLSCCQHRQNCQQISLEINKQCTPPWRDDASKREDQARTRSEPCQPFALSINTHFNRENQTCNENDRTKEKPDPAKYKQSMHDQNGVLSCALS